MHFLKAKEGINKFLYYRSLKPVINVSSNWTKDRSTDKILLEVKKTEKAPRKQLLLDFVHYKINLCGKFATK